MESEDRLTPHCKLYQKIFRKKYYNEQYDLEIIRRRDYPNDKKGKINDYNKKKRELELKFILARNLRSRTSSAVKSKNIRRMNKTIDFLGCSHSFFKNWIIHQLYGNMTLKNYGSVWQINHCLAIATFNFLDEKEMKKCFNWIKFRPMYVKNKIFEGDKIDMRLYLLQETKAKYFMKLND